MGISLDVAVPHQLGRAAARARIEARLPEIAGSLPAFVEKPEGAWRGDVFEFGFSALRRHISGRIAVLDRTVEITADLPLIALAFRRTIAETVRSRCEAVLSDAEMPDDRDRADPA